MLITKTKYMAGRQCPKFVWHKTHGRTTAAVEDAEDQPAIVPAQDVWLVARSLFPDGTPIDPSQSIRGRVAATHQALAGRKPVYNAACSNGYLYAQVDILVPTKGGWNIVQVKATTDIDDSFIQDVAFQYHVCRKARIPIRHCYIVTVNGEYIKRGAINAKRLFDVRPVDAEVKAVLRVVPGEVTRIKKVVEGKCPRVTIGPHCGTPKPCPLTDQCWAFLPRDNVFELHRIRASRAHDLFADGIKKITDLPKDFKLTQYQAVQIKSARTRKPHRDVPAIVDFLRQLKYPLRFFDFETFSTPIPMFDGTKPYQQIPFQYSMHVVASPKASPVHYSFLAEGRTDPRPGLLLRLKSDVGKTGTVLTFNMAFEKRVLQQLCEAFPSHKVWIRAALKRIADLIIPFREAAYYHPRQHGSNSLKKVMPALTNLSYDNLPIADGATAGQEFMRVTYGNVSQEEKDRVRRDLLLYCGQDTGGMLHILNALHKSASD